MPDLALAGFILVIVLVIAGLIWWDKRHPVPEQDDGEDL